MTRVVRRPASIATLAFVGCLAAIPASAQTKIKPGFNLFSVEQDQEIGRESALEAERQLPILDDRSVTQYIDAIGRRLAAVAPGARYAYQFKVVNASDVNAFALPGGYMYVNRGLIEAARSEGELAGVMAHEMAHVALRHGTHQASNAYLAQTGLGLLGGLASKPSTAKTIQQVGGFGMNALFLKYSRGDEKQADVVGAQILARAGYDPQDMVSFFQNLEAMEDRNPSKVAQFFSSHPALSDRAARVQEETKYLQVKVTAPVGGFTEVRNELRRMPVAPTMEQISQGYSGGTVSTTSNGSASDLRIPAPSERMRSYNSTGQFFQIRYPDNWRVYDTSGYGVTIAPEGGYVRTAEEANNLVYGVIVNHYDPFEYGTRQGIFQGRSGALRSSSGRVFDGYVDQDNDSIYESSNLELATNDLVRQLLRMNPSMRLVDDSARTGTSEGEPLLSAVMTGRSPVTGRNEHITVVTRELPDDHIIYAVFVAPSNEYDALRPTFNRMMTSLRVNDAADHE